MESSFMQKACKHCPFKRDVTPFLHPERAVDIAYSAYNPYSTFHCHKTTEADDNSDDGEMMVTTDSKLCAGHLTLQWHENGETWYDDEGFTPDSSCYENTEDMVYAYEEEWEKTLAKYAETKKASEDA